VWKVNKSYQPPNDVATQHHMPDEPSGGARWLHRKLSNIVHFPRGRRPLRVHMLVSFLIHSDNSEPPLAWHFEPVGEHALPRRQTGTGASGDHSRWDGHHRLLKFRRRVLGTV
jgi:hypothetical protein